MNLLSRARCLLGFGICALGFAARGADGAGGVTDWPQYRGPNRDAISPEAGLALDWKTQPPREMWRADVGNGCSSVVVVKNRAFAAGWSINHGGEDTVWCFDAETGAVLWKTSCANYAPGSLTTQGPMSTPCVDGDRIYLSSRSGRACCLRTDTGEIVWARDLRTETGSDRNELIGPNIGSLGDGPYNSSSPLVLGDLVIFGVGTTGTAVDKLTGKIRWGWCGGGQYYASAMRIPLDGADAVSSVDSDHVFHLINPANGSELRSPIHVSFHRFTLDPLVAGENVILHNEMYSLKTGARIWKSSFAGRYAPSLIHNGFLYLANQDGILSCIDLKDGAVKCSGNVIPRCGTYIMAQGKFLGVGNGELRVIQASPEGMKVECSVKLPDDEAGRSYQHSIGWHGGGAYFVLPSISDGRLYVRGSVSKVVAYDIRAPGHPRYNSNHAVASTTNATASALASAPAVVMPTDQDWPQWRGPQRNGVAPAGSQNLDWTRAHPKQLWQTHVGPALSGLALSGERIYTMGFSYEYAFDYGGGGAYNTIGCVDARNGQMIWEQRYAVPGRNRFSWPGLPRKFEFLSLRGSPSYFGCRATPALDADRVYTLDQAGIVTCLSATNGMLVWQKNVAKDLDLTLPDMFFSGSPLVLDHVVVLAIGTAGVALDQASGKVAWSTGKEACGNASPVLFEQAGKQRLALFGADQLFVLEPDTGKILWSYNWVDCYQRNLSDPVAVGNGQLLVCGAKDKGSALLQVGTDKPVWEQKSLNPLMGTPVLYQGYLYGPSQLHNGVVCVDAKTGAEKWTSEPMAAAQVILYGETLVIQCLNGEIHLAKASPQSYQSLGTCHPLPGESCFAPPVIAHGKLLCRSWEGDLVALDLAALEPNRGPAAALTADRMQAQIAQLNAPTQVKRQAAMDLLAQAHDAELTRLLPELLSTLKGGNWFAQDAAADVLQQLGAKAKPVAADLAGLVNGSIQKHDWAMVAILLETLKKVDPTALHAVSPVMLTAATDADKDVRIAAMQFLDRVPLTDGLLDALYAQARDDYPAVGSTIRRIGWQGAEAGEKLLPKFLPSLEQIGKPGLLSWDVTLFVMRDIGAGARKAIPALKAFADGPSRFDPRWAKEHADTALHYIKLNQHSDFDPLRICVYSNTPPTAKDMQLTCAKGAIVTARMACTDPDDFERTLEVTVLTQPAHGKVKITNLTMEYQPDADYTGRDSFTWKVADPTDDSNPATVSMQVTAGNAQDGK